MHDLLITIVFLFVLVCFFFVLNVQWALNKLHHGHMTIKLPLSVFIFFKNPES